MLLAMIVILAKYVIAVNPHAIHVNYVIAHVIHVIAVRIVIAVRVASVL